jgi:hypothetical protein
MCYTRGNKAVAIRVITQTGGIAASTSPACSPPVVLPALPLSAEDQLDDARVQQLPEHIEPSFDIRLDY